LVVFQVVQFQVVQFQFQSVVSLVLLDLLQLLVFRHNKELQNNKFLLSVVLLVSSQSLVSSQYLVSNLLRMTQTLLLRSTRHRATHRRASSQVSLPKDNSLATLHRVRLGNLLRLNSLVTLPKDNSLATLHRVRLGNLLRLNSLDTLPKDTRRRVSMAATNKDIPRNNQEATLDSLDTRRKATHLRDTHLRDTHRSRNNSHVAKVELLQDTQVTVDKRRTYAGAFGFEGNQVLCLGHEMINRRAFLVGQREPAQSLFFSSVRV
jgi:hypothetical protein